MSSKAEIYSLKDINVANNCLEKYSQTNINGFEVTALPLSHDVKCCGYVIKDEKVTSYVINIVKESSSKSIQTTDTVTVTMGGNDITATAYTASTGVVKIDKVTGNIAITVS